MRHRLQRFLPIVLIALAVQILAPVAASWAAANAAGPLRTVEICHGIPDPASSQTQGGGPSVHEEICLICCAVQASGTLDAPQQTALVAPHRQTTRMIWAILAGDLMPPRHGSHTQARAPPQPT
jgi:hypothetical protein